MDLSGPWNHGSSAGREDPCSAMGGGVSGAAMARAALSFSSVISTDENKRVHW